MNTRIIYIFLFVLFGLFANDLEIKDSQGHVLNENLLKGNGFQYENSQQDQGLSAKSLLLNPSSGSTWVIPDVSLTTLLSTENPSMREQVKREQVKKGNSNELLALLSHENPKVAAFSAEILGLIGDEESLVPLLLASQSPSDELRAASALALGYMADSSALNRLNKTITDPNAVVRRNSAIAMGNLGFSSCLHLLYAGLSDEDYSVRYSSQIAIGAIGDTLSADVLAEMLPLAKAPNSHHIIVAIGILRDVSSIELLLSLTESPDFHVRGFAFESLSNYPGNYRIANCMKKGLSDTSPFVKTKCKDALWKLSSEIPI